MEAQKDPNALQENQINFSPETEARIEDISLNLQNLEIDEGEVLKEIELNNRYEQFMNENEYQSLFEDYINVKKSNINEVYANPLYFIKKIIYFYNKETFLDPYFLYLKSFPLTCQEKASCWKMKIKEESTIAKSGTFSKNIPIIDDLGIIL